MNTQQETTIKFTDKHKISLGDCELKIIISTQKNQHILSVIM